MGWWGFPIPYSLAEREYCAENLPAGPCGACLVRPVPAPQPPVVPLNRHGPGIPRTRRQAAHRPALRFRGSSTVSQQSSRLAGSQRDVELVEWDGQPLAAGLDVRFLARPAIEEGRNPEMIRQTAQHSGFVRRKESLGDRLPCKVRPDVLDINTHFALPCHRIQRQPMRVAQVEAQPFLSD